MEAGRTLVRFTLFIGICDVCPPGKRLIIIIIIAITVNKSRTFLWPNIRIPCVMVTRD